jgi:hypothetical protein
LIVSVKVQENGKIFLHFKMATEVPSNDFAYADC